MWVVVPKVRPFRVGGAAAIAEFCRDPEIPRFTMMPEGLTEDQAWRWIEPGLNGGRAVPALR